MFLQKGAFATKGLPEKRSITWSSILLLQDGSYSWDPPPRQSHSSMLHVLFGNCKVRVACDGFFRTTAARGSL